MTLVGLWAMTSESFLGLKLSLSIDQSELSLKLRLVGPSFMILSHNDFLEVGRDGSEERE